MAAAVTASVIRGDARHLPLPDNSVDLVVTSPPYYGLRSYTDGGAHYDGQLGSEATPAAYVDALVACTAEWMRVLKPSGSMFVNLGDKYAGSDGTKGGTAASTLGGGRANGRARDFGDVTFNGGGRRVPGQPKSLLGLPWRYALACTDRLGLILRAEIIWAKPNGLPESVQDRVRRSHEQVFHFVLRPRYYSAVDHIREPHTAKPQRRFVPMKPRPMNADAPGIDNWVSDGMLRDQPGNDGHPLGKLPGSVWDDTIWTIPSQPFTPPPHLGDHFAAFPMELPRRLILGWSPPGVCTACGEGRRPVASKTYRTDHFCAEDRRSTALRDSGLHNRVPQNERPFGVASTLTTIAGYACACTPYTDHPAGGSTRRRDRVPDGTKPHGTYGRHQAGEYEPVGPWREYHDWTPPPTRPAVVLDPFGGTGTTALIADAYGRHGITIDRSADYCRLATWRTRDAAQRAAAMQVPKPPVVSDDQQTLFDTA